MFKSKAYILSTCLLISLNISLAVAQSKPVKPNIVFILADDLGYGDLGCYGQQLIKTPNIDKLAADGMRFTQFYAGSPVCAPSRAALMTGLHTGHTAIRGNKGMKPEGQYPLPASSFTIAEVLKKGGYVTGDFGKWGLGFVGTEGDPLRQGFDAFYGYNCQTLAHDFFPEHLWDNKTKVTFPNTPSRHEVYAGDLINEKALKFIDVNYKKPFFLYLSYTLPHAALQLPAGDKTMESYKQQFNEQAVPVKLPWNGEGYEPQPYPHAAYAAMVSRLDSYVGSIMDKLKTFGVDKNTLVIFSSDNGPHKEGGNEPNFFNSNGGLRGIKRDVFEGGIRVPMIACWPGVVKPGSVSNYVGAFWDFLPTFAEIAGQRPPENIDGVSILQTLQSKKNQPEHKFLYWEFYEEGGKQAVRMGKWKGVRLKVFENADAPVQLYDLETDVKETNDIAAKNPAIVNEIKKIMQQSHVENNVFPFKSATAKK